MKNAENSKWQGRMPKLCVLPGEGAAADAVLASMKVFEAMDLPIETDLLDLQTMSKEELFHHMDNSDATLFGAMADGVDMLGYLRWTRETYANVRPAKYRRNFHSPLKHPEGIDFVIVRENLEGLYPPKEGNVSELAEVAKLHPEWCKLDSGIYALKVITEENTRNVARYAAKVAQQRKQAGFKGMVTIGTKHNMLRRSDGLFRDVALDELSKYPGVQVEVCIIDALLHRMVTNPHSLDVVLMPNLYGDILADGASGLIGGLGVAPSACIGDHYAYFEPVHGTAPDIEGKGIINPTATLLAMAMSFDYLGFPEAQAKLEKAIEAVYSEGKALTPDQGGTAGTDDFCNAVIAAL